MRKTLAARENYRRLAKTAAKIFFIINAFSQLEHMYQLALDTYINLFTTNIVKYLEKNPALSDTLDDKLDNISERHK
jgi:dynein heavy chain